MAEYNSKRRTLSFGFLILLGLMLGLLIKRVHIGLLIGLAIGLLATVLGPRRK